MYITQELPDGRDAQGVRGGVGRLCSLSGPLSPHLHVFGSSGALQSLFVCLVGSGFYGGFIT